MTNSFFNPSEDDEDDFPLASRPARATRQREDALALLPRVMLETALGRSGMTALKGNRSFCLVVETRSDEWIAPLDRFIRNYGNWDKIVTRTSDQARRKDESTGPDVLRRLADGGRVAGIASRFGYLPDAMITGADLKIELPKITTEIIETVIRRMSGKRVTVSLAVARLGFADLVACLRSSDTAAANVARLERAASAVRSITPIEDDVPHLQDLHGYGAARTWGLELIEDVEAWRRGEIEFDAISSRNCVLVSPPGCGKSSYAKSLAKSLGVPLLATSVGQWFSNSSGHLDAIIKQIDAVFASAAAAAPAVLLLDELDGMPNRARLDSRNSDWWMPVITHMLTTLDSAVSGVADQLIVIGATNHGDKLDSALIRSGRLDRQIHIGPPDAKALRGIIRQHLGPDLAGEDLEDVASMAVGGTGADVVVWVRAARRTARHAGRPMQMSDLADVIAPPDDRDPALVERIALHEAGHAVASYVLGVGKVLSVSIVSNGFSGGVTVTDFDGEMPTKAAVENVVQQALAGRAAEEVFLGEPGTGAGGMAASDLARATRALGLLHLGTGLGNDLIFRADADSVPSVLAVNERLAQAVDADLRQHYARTLDLIRENAHLVRAVADALLARRHLGPAAFLEIVDRVQGTRLVKEHSNG
jgi:ATP-dependent Zn protease